MLSAVSILCCFAAASEGVVLEIPSRLDDTVQPCRFIPATDEAPRPLLVILHPWSHGYDTFDLSDWTAAAAKRNWHALLPHFRGPNNTPAACGSKLARQDILDAVDHVCRAYAVDERRIYVAGGSGGGHMTLVMAAHAPERWAAASAWCPITDLAAWHAESVAAGRKYAKDIEEVVGGAPGDSAAVDGELRYRSPLFHLAQAKDLPVAIATGIHDGHTGSVPIHHTLDAFNVLAEALGAPQVSPEAIAGLSAEKALEDEAPQDPSYGRYIYLRRKAGPSQVTLFEGGHEALPEAACDWLAQHIRPE